MGYGPWHSWGLSNKNMQWAYGANSVPFSCRRPVTGCMIYWMALMWSRTHYLLSLTWASGSRYNVFPWQYINFTNPMSLQTKSRPMVAEVHCNMVIANKNYKIFFAHRCLQDFSQCSVRWVKELCRRPTVRVYCVFNIISTPPRKQRFELSSLQFCHLK